MSYLCAICSQPIHGIFRNNLICHDCFITYRDDILAKTEWVVYCQQWERKRRYSEARDIKAGLTYGLGESVDVVKSDTGYKLIKIADDG